MPSVNDLKTFLLQNFTKTESFIIFIIVSILLLSLFIFLIVVICKFFINPFDYPHVYVHFDISRKRQPVYEDYVDQWINDLPEHRKGIHKEFFKVFDKWNLDCKRFLEHCILYKKRRTKMYNKMRHEVIQNDYEMFEFLFTRDRTQYKQKNNVKYSYKIQAEDNILRFSLQEMFEIADELEEIDYQTTRAKWSYKHQRNLMTKELREKIKERDDYTCQICGKYMPDEVGLHIDHIIPVKKGGKTVESNLQVLCDKCNLKKGKN